MPDEPPITHLCGVCYEHPPKYRCPRCQAKTCSLPCTQKHKLRAACNGTRNPAEYLRRSQLATPVGIDRDYNYLKGIERTIDVASRECEHRGVNIVERAAARSLARARHPESSLRKYLTENRIHVRRAPNGMSRQKSNQTRSTKRQLIVWTVEWIDAAGRKCYSNSCLANSSIRDLYALKQAEDSNAMKRRPGEGARQAYKRRRQGKQAEVGVEERLTSEGESSVKQEMPASIVEAATTEQSKGLAEFATGLAAGLQYYLLRPETSAMEKVLIPLDQEATLTSCLRDRTVLEYPTIHVLPYVPASLPRDYLLESQYLQRQKGEERAKAEERDVVDRVALSEAATTSTPYSILNVLKRDLTR